MNDKLWKLTERLTDVCIFGVLWLVCSLPIVTVGAASAALHAAMGDRLTHGSRERVKPFFRAFRLHFKKATILWLTIFPLMIVFALDAVYYLVWNGDGVWNRAMGAVQVLLFVHAFAISCYAFPLLTLYNRKVRDVLLLSLQSCYRHWPWTLLILAVHAAAVALLWIGLWPYIYLFAGMLGYVSSLIMVRILRE